jgi:hypothetical protein
VASCCAIGRSSVDATNACRIRAVRAALAARLALLARLAGLRLFVEPLFVAAFVPLDFFFVVPAALFPVLPELWLELFVEGEGESPALCPATGITTIRTQSRPDAHRVAGLKIEIGEQNTLIYSL